MTEWRSEHPSQPDPATAPDWRPSPTPRSAQGDPSAAETDEPPTADPAVDAAESVAPDQPGAPAALPTGRIAGLLLLVAAVVTVGGSFLDLSRTTTGLSTPVVPNGQRPVETIRISPWFEHISVGQIHLPAMFQLLGVAPAVGALLAALTSVPLVLGRAGPRGLARPLGIVAGAILVGVLLAEDMLPVSSMMFDSNAPDRLVTTAFGTGFVVFLIAGLVTLGAVALLVPGLRRPVPVGALDSQPDTPPPDEPIVHRV